MTDPALLGALPAPDLHIMSFNIRRPMSHIGRRSPDRWDRRMPLVTELLRTERPAVLGVQEAVPEQAKTVRHALGRRYRTIGHGRRADRSGEGCPLYYDAERLELVKWKQSALSDRPDTPGSMSWGNVIPRIVVAATFVDRETSARFLVLNTHLDHISRRSRLLSARALRSMVERQPVPAVVMGDFNTGESSAPLRELTTDGALADTWAAAADRLTPKWGTFANYREPRPGRKRIDWILASPDVTVTLAAINARRIDGGWPSDHLPVHAVLRMPGAA